MRQKAASPFVPAAAASPLLHEVLGGTALPHAGNHENQSKDSLSLLSRSLSVGARFEAAKKRAIETGSGLLALVDAQTAEIIKALLEDLEKSVCCIAFTGQVKAGKSSLINALVEETDLLPADINPWTTVITRLHFGVPGKPQSGASFTFFTREEWRRLSSGGRTRELTERIFPDFDWSALKVHVEAMQNQARLKLGARFEDLLGTEHTYPEINPGLLNLYVGAGQPRPGDVAKSRDGEYSEITKTADVYLDLGPFSFPAILIDTPGINDPFLVRDEITRQNLESSDICVIVLTARQPLSLSDFGLLRMLRGLKKDRLIIFINKIDEISGSDELLDEISRRVKAMLKLEFPHANIPIVFGSAIFAQRAMSLNGSERLTAQTQDLSEPIPGVHWPNQDEIAEAATADALFRKSGLTSLAVAISEFMEAGPIADSVGSAERLLAAVRRSLVFWLETEIDILCKVPADYALARGALEPLVAIQAHAAAEFEAFSNGLRQLCAHKAQQLRHNLMHTASASVADSLSSQPVEELSRQAVEVDAKLRNKLESVFLAALEDARDAIIGDRESLRSGITEFFKAMGLGEQTVIFAGDELGGLPYPSALSEPAALDLTASLDQFALADPQTEQQLANVLKVIAADLEPVIEKLVNEASMVLFEKSANLEKKARALTLGPLESAVERISAVLTSVESSGVFSPSAQLYVEQSIQSLRERLGSLKATPIASG